MVETHANVTILQILQALGALYGGASCILRRACLPCDRAVLRSTHGGEVTLEAQTGWLAPAGPAALVRPARLRG